MMILAFISLSIGFLMHGGVLFSILGMLIVFYFSLLFSIKERKELIKYFLFLIFTLVPILPWTIYQKYYDPPGDHLFKMRMAGQRNLDDPILYPNHPRVKTGQSLLGALQEAYTTVPVESIISNKISNLVTVFKNPLIDGSYFKDFSSVKDFIPLIRSDQFFYTFASLDFILIGFILVFIKDNGGNEILIASQKKLFLILIGSLLLWILLMFEPNATIIHQGSYVNLFLLFILASIGLDKMNEWKWIFLFLHFLVFVTWIPSHNQDIDMTNAFGLSKIIFSVCCYGFAIKKI